MKAVGCPPGKYRGVLSPKWKGGEEATKIRQKFAYQRPFLCLDCRLPFEGKEGCNSKYCPACRSVLSICSYCQSSFNISRKDFNDGRGRYCGLPCYRTHLALFPKTGSEANAWKGGVTLNYGYGNRFKATYLARRTNAGGTFTRRQWNALKNRTDHRCLSCKKQEPHIILEADHIVPLAKGGTNDISNIQPLCRSCNARKYDKTIDYSRNVTLI